MMKTSVQTVRLPSTPTPNPKRLSRTSSCSLSTIHRLSCAPDESALLSLALSPSTRPPIEPPTKMPMPPTEDDHLYEEITSHFVRTPLNGNVRAAPRPRPLQLSSSAWSSNGIPSDPPKLAPVSGVLHSKDTSALIRPIAFKPYVRTPVDGAPAPLASPKTPLSHTCFASITPNNQFAYPDQLQQRRPIVADKLDCIAGTSRKPTGRSLSDPWKGSGQRKLVPATSANNSDYSNSRSTPSSIREDSTQMVYYPSSSEKSSYGYVSCSDRSAESLYGAHKTYHARVIRPDDETDYGFDPYQITSTPSPSDSGIAINFEALLRDKDNEIATLRTTMELNEGVIFKVHEEKEAAWRKHMDAVRHHYESLLQKQSTESLTGQTELARTIDQLRQQNLKLSQQLQSASENKPSTEDSIQPLRTKLQETEARLDEANYTIRKKNNQIAVLKKLRGNDDQDPALQVVQLQNSLDNAQKEALQRNLELKDLRQTLNFLSQELFQVQQKFDSAREELEQRRETAANRSKRSSLLVGNSDGLSTMEVNEIERLRGDLADVRAKYGTEKRAMEEERASWFEEKEKVIKYQKQLQLNYLEIYKRNCSLETELDDINASLRINDLDHDQELGVVRESDC